MKNPWKNISWKDTIAECDKDVIYPSYCADKGIDISNLPEPFSGNINSHVVCLNLNPGIGKCDVCFRFDCNFLKETKATLSQEIGSTKTQKQFMWFTNIKCAKGILHEGCEWWRRRSKDLVKAISPTPLNLFVIEFFPYHSAKAFNFPTLPSDEYRNDLVDDALNNQKLIIITRGKKLWYSIKDRDIGKRLQAYPNIIVLSNPRNVTFTAKTVGTDWRKLVSELKKTII